VGAVTSAPAGIRVGAAFLIALGVTFAVTPLARRLAIRTGFLDHPAGYKQHGRATPYLGGLAVMAGILAALLVVDVADDFKRLVASALILCGLGTLDDRIGLGVGPRFIAQFATAVTLWAVNLGWTIFGGDVLNLVFTIVWVVGITNAFNLMDNQDGATGTVAAVCGAGAGAVALIQGDVGLAVIAFALSGACVGFLPFNLSKPAKIFLGDGGSMPIGLLVACAVMALPDQDSDWSMLLATAPLVGLPILDTTLVVFSRARRRAPIFSGDRTHLTHRLLALLGTERKVAAALAGAQALLCALAIALVNLDPQAILAATAAYLVAGAAMITLLETPGLLPSHEERVS
jgi:UDP-GlcNAc:undecaprenyl-phosphate/decaprenyl-phosphate GlcNAc-1-phosphate transferase